MVAAQKLNDVAEAPPTILGGRYRIEQLLGRGGMAEVYRVFDLSTSREVALKRLTHRASSDFASHIVQLFEREFRTLSQLVHPRIIEAYDYNHDENGPYYTMELLDGGDLRGLSPLPWRQAAKFLSDACSALSLLHSRRLLHRDLTPLNIRCTRDGHAKLFDFGSMARTGVSKHIVGTPPFIAPEALAGQVLDARTDLFALGATAYFALTGRHAYPARNLASLDEIWKKPIASLSQLAPDVPPALEDLVMSLLQLEPDHRPRTAAEVMERLSAIAGFALDDSLQVQRAYLATPSLVGREELLTRARKHFARALSRNGGALVIHGASGVGRSRFLDACALEAKLSGALVLRADARDASAGKWGATRALLRQLIAEAPELAQSSLAPHLDVLIQVLPDLVSSLSAPEGSSKAPAAAISGGEGDRAELRSAAQTALRAAFCQVAEQRLLMIAVDDASRLDEPSAALIALLAHEARERALLVFATAVSESNDDLAARAVSLLLSTGDAVRLRNLTPIETQQLMMSLFGDVPNVRLLADRLHVASSGNPSVIMQMAQQLLDRGVVRYGAGAWLLPPAIEVDHLPSSVSARLAETVDGLSERTRMLAEAIALCEVRSLSFDDCLELTEHADPQRLACDLDELLAAQVLTREESRYFFTRPEFERILSERSAIGDLRTLHLRAAKLFARRDDEHFRTAIHLLRGGEPARAIDLLVHFFESTRDTRVRDLNVAFEYVQSLPKHWRDDFKALIAACEALKRPKRDRWVLQVNLVSFATQMGGSEPEHLCEVAAQLRHDSGLDIYDQLTKEPVDTRLHAALAQAIQRYEVSSDRERVLPPLEAIPRLAQLMIIAIGMAGRTLDYELLASMPSLAPLAPLSPALSVVQRDAEATLFALSAQLDAARSVFLDVLNRIEQPDRAGLEATFHGPLRLAVIMAVGNLEVAQGLPSAERWARPLDSMPLFAVTACRLRMQGALIMGDLRKAEEHRAAGERLQIQNCPAQAFEGTHLWPHVIAQTDAEDLLRVKQSVSEIEAMAREFPHWQPCLHFARGAYQSLRGDITVAIEELDKALALAPLGRHVAWPGIATRLIQMLNRAGRFGEALERGRAMIELLERHKFEVHTYPLLAALGLAEAALGDVETGARYVEASISDLEMRGAQCVVLGIAYETRARVAIYARDAAAFDQYAPLCEEQYRAGQNPALIARYKRLLRDVGATNIPITIDTESATTTIALEDTPVTIATLLSSCKGGEDRAMRSLELIAQKSQSVSGYLYTVHKDGPVLLARYGSVTPIPHLERLVAEHLHTAMLGQADMEATTINIVPHNVVPDFSRLEVW
ncbi:MAG TPA: protein kinase, partial [Polyangiales bacterium]|nr:protein kinase [Polyangiales bacterium]